MQPHLWTEAVEMQFAALRLIERYEHEHDEQAPSELLDSLRCAETYTWAPEPLDAVTIAARTIPDSATISAVTLPSPCGFWWLGHSPSRPFSALLWNVGSRKGRDDRLLYLALFNQVRGEQNDWNAPCLGNVMAWPIDVSLAQGLSFTMEVLSTPIWNNTKEHARPAMTFFLAGCVWLQQRILVTRAGHIERHRRKQLAREHHAPLPGDIKIVELRRRESTATPNQNPASVEWSCQWIVDGHWTHQAHGPGHSERRLQYVLPYLKGPDDKPLKVPKQTVYVVDR